jgi:hypothetical protein
MKVTVKTVFWTATLLCACLYGEASTVNPPNPDVKTIKRDLVGRTLYSASEQRRNSFKIELQNEIRSITISDVRKSENGLRYAVALTLDNDINQFNAGIYIHYKLSKNNEWIVSHVETRALKVVSSGQYDNCISVKAEQVLFTDHLFFHNNCDVALVVEGVVYAWSSTGHGREWRPFDIDVPANGKAEFHYETDADYKIKRIERP